jgi:hypothetical protein
VLRSPSDQGRLELIVRRPATNEREVLATNGMVFVLGVAVSKTFYAHFRNTSGERVDVVERAGSASATGGRAGSVGGR